MKKYYLFALVLIVILFYFKLKTDDNSISEDTISKGDQLMDLIKSQKYFIDSTGWVKISENYYDENFHFSLSKIEKDTSKFLTLVADKDGYVINIESYYKEFFIDDYLHCISFKKDTFYHYAQSPFGEKTFFVGEYNYRFENALLEVEELDYYVMYSDSLGKVKGTNLPKLRELNSFEKAKFDEKLKQSE